MEAVLHIAERTVQEIVGSPFPHLDSGCDSRVQTRACRIAAHPTHPGHRLFAPLSSGKRYKNISTHINRLNHSFFPKAMKSINPSPY